MRISFAKNENHLGFLYRHIFAIFVQTIISSGIGILLRGDFRPGKLNIIESMAIVKCPNCGAQCSDKVSVCPVCGRSINSILPESTEEKKPAHTANEPIVSSRGTTTQPQEEKQKPAKNNKLLVLLLAFISVLLIGLIVVGGILVSKFRQNDPNAEFTDGAGNVAPVLRSDISRPQMDNHETVPFPLNRVFVSSGSNFVIRETSGTYFAYSPSEHWGVYMFHNDKRDYWTTRYLYCSGWDSRTNTLTLTAYNHQGEYDGMMSGTFTRQGDRYTYNCVFTNYRGKQATYKITEDSINNYVPSGERRIYSCAFDGYVIMRAAPTLQSDKVGKFRNGPQGATYLGEQAGWTQINYNGTIGWVNAAYITSSPTKEVTVDVDGDYLEGIWLDGFSHYLIFNNGKYVVEIDTSEGGSMKGHYYLEGDEIIFEVDDYDLPEWYDKPTASRYRIDGRTKLIDGLERESFISEEEARQMAIEGMGGSLYWTKKEFKKIKARTL